MKRTSITARTFTALAVLAVAIAPAAKAANKGCTNASIQGTFSQKGTGVLTAPPSMAGPLANVGTIQFDGNGNISGALTNSINGNIVQVTFTGTYTVNPDCTGTYTSLLAPIGVTAHAFFVIDDNETEIQIITTDPGNVVTCVARRQFPVGDWRQ